MTTFVRMLQIALSLWNIIGGVYMMGHYSSLASTWALNTLPAVFWIVLGVVQILLASALLISIKSGLRRFATPSALCLAAVSLLGSVIYSAYAGFPGILWSLIPAVVLLFIAYKSKI